MRIGVRTPAEGSHFVAERMKYADPPRSSLELEGGRMWLASVWIEDEDAILAETIKVEHAVDRTGDRIERSASETFAAKPVIFDKADDRALIRRGVIYEVSPGVR